MLRPAVRVALAAGILVTACVPSPAPVAAPAPAGADTVHRAAPAPPPRHVTRPAAPAPSAGPVPLPPIPFVAGSLEVNVVYPPAGHVITSPDSTFIIGSVGNGDASLTVDGQPVRVYPNGAFMGFVANPPASTPTYELTAVLGTDTVHAARTVQVPSPVTLPVPPPAFDSTVGWVRLVLPNSMLPDTDQTIIGRPVPGETYHWFLLPGTLVLRDGEVGGYSRLRLDSALHIWVPDSLAEPVDVAQPPERVTGNAVVVSAAGYEDLIIPVAARPAYRVHEGDRTLDLTLYDTRGATDIVRYPTDDSLIRRVDWRQVRDDRVRFTVHLDAQPFGYLVLWEPGRFVLRVRRPPVVDPAHPLRGRVIVVDPGHPPAGATGPTGLYEGDAVLAVAWRLDALLEAQGATVVMTRTTPDTVALEDRPVIARRADGDAYVSLHLNAFPDGVNPFTAVEGTTTFFYYGQSEPLARAVQTGLVHAMGLPDQGVVFRSLAVVRQTWMPSVLCEGAFVIIPAQEAALRTPAFQEAYARGVRDGLVAYFRGLRSRR